MNYKTNIILDFKSTKNINPYSPVGVYIIITKCFRKEKHNDRIKISLNTKVAPIHFGLEKNNYKYDESTVKKNQQKNGWLQQTINNTNIAITKTLLNFQQQGETPSKEDFRITLLFNLSRISQAEYNEHFFPTNFDIDINLTDYLKEKIAEFYENLKTKNDDSIGEGRITGYKTLFGHLKNYENYYDKRLSLKKFTKEDHKHFFDFMEQYGAGVIKLKESFLCKRSKRLKDGYAQNTISTLNKVLIALFNRAKNIDDIEIKFNTHSKSIKFSQVRGMKDTYLSEEDFKVIFNTATNNEAAALAKSYLIIAFCMGLRYQSVKYLGGKKPELKKVNNSTFYAATTLLGKINDRTFATVPLPDILVDYLTINHGGIFPKLPETSTVNKNIKDFLENINEMQDEVNLQCHRFKQGIIDRKKFKYQIVSTHDCRSSYISNLANLEIPREYVKNITHPKAKSVATAYDVYDKRDLDSKALLLAKSIDRTNTKTVYKISIN